MDVSASDNIVTNYFKEFVSAKTSNLTELSAEKFDQLAQAISFIKQDDEVVSMEMKDELLDYVLTNHADILAKFEAYGFNRQSIESILVLEMLISRYY